MNYDWTGFPEDLDNVIEDQMSLDEYEFLSGPPNQHPEDYLEQIAAYYGQPSEPAPF